MKTQFITPTDHEMREDFLETLGNTQIAVTLVRGKTTIECFVVDVTIDGFLVAVPGVARYEGDPRMMLVMHNTKYPVKLTRQTQHAAGYSYHLARIKDWTSMSDESLRAFRWCSQTLRYCAVALVAAVGASCFCVGSDNIGSVNDCIARLSLGRFRSEAFGFCAQLKSRNDNEGDGTPPTTSLIDDVMSPHGTRPRELNSGAYSDSVISPASLSSAVEASSATAIRRSPNDTGATDSSGRPNSVSRQKQAVTNSLRPILEAGRVGRMQLLNESLVPWLFGSGRHDDVLSLRTSDAALVDLKQFKAGLRGLPRQISEDAIACLKQTLILVNSGEARARSVPGMRDVLVVVSPDANVYFRSVQGRTELVRVLPAETN